MLHPNGRAVGGTELNWCREVVSGTGIAVLAIHSSLDPNMHIARLKNALHDLHTSHPILGSRLHYNPTSNTYSFVTTPSPSVQINRFSHAATSRILECDRKISPLHLVLEHELNQNAWTSSATSTKTDVVFASVYALPGANGCVLVLCLHAAACDRTTAVSLLRELLTLMAVEEEGRIEITVNKGEMSLAIEDLVRRGMAKKTIWARGVDMLSYSVSSLRLTNLKFIDAKSQRSMVFRTGPGCKARGIKLCGALAAAGLMATHSSKSRSDHQKKKYGVVTLTDCRSILEPPLLDHHFGFYHTAILNTHTIKGGEKLWELAKKTYTTFTNYKSSGRHLSDMADLNFLMCRAMENPSLTPSSSLRTCLLSVFEDTVVDESNDEQNRVGIEDYMGCASGHGIGSSIAVFDTVRDGRLDCVCVYPSPLHSREQMQELVDKMKCILVDAGNNMVDETNI
ncbi:hypothetical protein F3Y22_tig00110833pilonHSYRG00231 [Hibiscus syriacus]|uniref:Uncharacterized protein n=1 Tax=Hibiscus syriacus TaxID=106335 RepID=A0A6A2ZNQ5_HIBSY|nr:hypothetical protein F3Y22_tig00110833pilonHSYRG00231 [Hibiscus syriacus]